MTSPPHSAERPNWLQTNYGDSVSCHGQWWPAGQKEIAEQGTLYGPIDGLYFLSVRLANHSWLDHPDAEESIGAQVPSNQVIHGFTDHGVNITLLNAHRSGYVDRYPGINELSLCSSLLITGYHILSEDDLCAKRVVMSFSDLEIWFGDRPFWTSDSSDHLSFGFEPGKSFSFETDFAGGGILKSNYQIIHSDGLQLVGSFARQMEFLPRSGSVSIKKALDVAYGLAELLTLISGIPTAIRYVWILNEASARGTVLSMPSFPIPEKDISKWYSSRVMFKFQVLQGDVAHAGSGDGTPRFEAVLSSFLRLGEKQSSALNLFFALQKKPDYYIELKLTAATQALEAYCRAGGYAADIVSASEYKKLRKDLEVFAKGHLPPELVQPIVDRLRYANQASFREQIERLLDGMDYVLVAQITGDSVANFAGQITKVRNSLVHQGSKPQEDSGMNLIEILDRITVLLYMLFLRELGFSSESIASALSNSMHWQNLLHARMPVSPQLHADEVDESTE